MRRWAYRIVMSPGGLDQLVTILNEHGAQGWRLRFVAGDKFVFERPLPADPEAN